MVASGGIQKSHRELMNHGLEGSSWRGIIMNDRIGKYFHQVSKGNCQNILESDTKNIQFQIFQVFLPFPFSRKLLLLEKTNTCSK